MNIERFFGGRTVLGLRTQDRPARGVGVPTLPHPPREAPRPPIQQDQAIKEVLEKALRDSGDVFQKPKRTKNKGKLIVGSAIAAGLIGTAIWGGINKIGGDDEPTPQTSSADFHNSRTDNRLVPRTEAEAKKVNPKEIFDPYAERQEITLKNIVFMSPEERKNIVPPVIDPKHPERVNIFFPILFAEGSGDRKIVIEKRVQQPSLTGGYRNIFSKTDSDNTTPPLDGKFLVKSTYVITSGLMPGDRLIASASGMIVRGGTDEPDANGIINLQNGGFRIETQDDKSNHSNVGFGGRGLKLKLTKDLRASTTIIEEVQVGNITTTGSRLESHPVPIQEGEEIGIIIEAGKDPDLSGQFAITVGSLVTGEDGKTQGGPAEIMSHITTDGKLITPK